MATFDVYFKSTVYHFISSQLLTILFQSTVYHFISSQLLTISFLVNC